MKDSSKSSDYEIGYKKPPKQHQFPKGQSGNPKGRRKEPLLPYRTMKQLMGEELQKTMIVKVGGKRPA